MNEYTSVNSYKEGFKDGIPIGLGYLSVSFTFGMMAVNTGLPVWIAVLISMTNLTSAGQFAGIGLIAAGAPYIEMALTQMVINMRYALMSISLSQKTDSTFSLIHRLITSFGITDEVFAVASEKPGILAQNICTGLLLLLYLGWTAGTLLGAVQAPSCPNHFVPPLISPFTACLLL